MRDDAIVYRKLNANHEAIQRRGIQMKILFDIGHAAHVHLFRNAIRTLQGRGHGITVSIRDKPVIRQLLRHYGVEPYNASTPRETLPGLAWELLEHDYNVLRLARKCGFDVLAGTSVAAAHVGRLVGAKSAVFSEDDAQVVKLFSTITYPFAHKVVVPTVVSDKRKANYICHPSYHELAYLHPNHYRADPIVLDELGVTQGEPYFIVRLVSFKAHHDVGEQGIGRQLRTRLIELLSRHGQVFLTVEGDIPDELRAYQMTLPPHRMHDALAFARMVISDSQTMTAEAAVLGVPAIRCNSFVGRLSYLQELESTYELTYGFLPSDIELMLDRIRILLETGNIVEQWQSRRERMLVDKVDFHEWMVNFIEEL